MSQVKNKEKDKDVRDLETSNLIDPRTFEVDEDEARDSIKEVMFKMLIGSMLSDDNLSTKTELTSRQVIVHAKARIFEDIYQTGIIGALTDWVEKNMLSHKRASRGEIVKMMQNVDLDDEEQMKTLKNKLLGG